MMNMENINFRSTEEEVVKKDANESFESMQERMEVLKGIVEEFKSEVSRDLYDFEKSAKTTFSLENGYDDSLKLQKLTNIVSKLSVFQSHVHAIMQLFDKKDGAMGLNFLWSSLDDLIDQLSIAPDIRYSREAQIEKYNGKENVPAEKVLDTFEHTQELIISLRNEIKGIDTALNFMNPEKIQK